MASYIAGEDVHFDYVDQPAVDAALQRPDEEYPESRVIRQGANGEVIVSEFDGEYGDEYSTEGSIHSSDEDEYSSTSQLENRRRALERQKALIRRQLKAPSRGNYMWDSSMSLEEKKKIRGFWVDLPEAKKKVIVDVSSEDVLAAVRSEPRPSCNCRACGTRRLMLEKELEKLYRGYYSLRRLADSSVDEHQMNCRLVDTFLGVVPVVPDSVGPDQEEDVMSVAEDLLQNDGRKFISLVQQLDNEWKTRTGSPATNSSPAANSSSTANSSTAANSSPATTGEQVQVATNEHAHSHDHSHDHSHAHSDGYDEDYDDEYDDDSQYSDEYDDDYYEKEEETRQRLEETNRMLQMLTGKILRRKLLGAYKEQVAEESRRALLEELEAEELEKKQKEARDRERKEKQKEKKRQQQIAREEEKKRKENERLELEEKQREEQRQRAEEGRKRKEAERKKKEEKKREEKRKRKEAEEKAKAEERAKAEAEAKVKAEAAAKAEAKAKAKAEAEAKAEERAKAEAEAKVKAEALAMARAKAEADSNAKTKAEAKLKARAEAEEAIKLQAMREHEEDEQLEVMEMARREAHRRRGMEQMMKREADSKAREQVRRASEASQASISPWTTNAQLNNPQLTHQLSNLQLNNQQLNRPLNNNFMPVNNNNLGGLNGSLPNNFDVDFLSQYLGSASLKDTSNGLGNGLSGNSLGLSGSNLGVPLGGTMLGSDIWGSGKSIWGSTPSQTQVPPQVPQVPHVPQMQPPSRTTQAPPGLQANPNWSGSGVSHSDAQRLQTEFLRAVPQLPVEANGCYSVPLVYQYMTTAMGLSVGQSPFLAALATPVQELGIRIDIIKDDFGNASLIRLSKQVQQPQAPQHRQQLQHSQRSAQPLFDDLGMMNSFGFNSSWSMH